MYLCNTFNNDEKYEEKGYLIYIHGNVGFCRRGTNGYLAATDRL